MDEYYRLSGIVVGRARREKPSLIEVEKIVSEPVKNTPQPMYEPIDFCYLARIFNYNLK